MYLFGNAKINVENNGQPKKKNYKLLLVTIIYNLCIRIVK